MSAAPAAMLFACPPVYVNRTFAPADVGPHFNQSGELWWYLGALDRDDGGGLVGVQLSFFRKSSDNCTDASRNDVISTLAIGLPPDRYARTTRITPVINVSRWRAEPYSLALGARWGATAAASRSRQRLRAGLISATPRGFRPIWPRRCGAICAWATVGSRCCRAQARRRPCSGTSRSRGFRRAAPCACNISLRSRRDAVAAHLVVGRAGRRVPTWNWSTSSRPTGSTLCSGSRSDRPDGGVGLPRARRPYGNLVDPRGASAALNWSDVCIRVATSTRTRNAACATRFAATSASARS